YLVSKWASEGLMRMLAEELETHPAIRVNSINPGKVRTNMRLQAYPAGDRSTLPGPETIVGPYLYLFGPDSRGVPGQTSDYQQARAVHPNFLPARGAHRSHMRT